MKTLSKIFLPLFALPLFHACDKLPENGDLDGMWRLESLHTKQADGSYAAQDGTAGAKVFWSFQLQLLDIKADAVPEGVPARLLARFSHAGGALSVTQAFLPDRAAGTDLPVESGEHPEYLLLGLRRTPQTFRVVRLDSRRMTLCSEADSLVFKKI